VGPTAAKPQRVELSDFIEAYESAQERDGQADLSQFLPPPEHPLYPAVLRELIRVDLEYGWQRGQPRRLEEYQRLFPCLANDPAGLQEIAFEEYRQRRQAGESATPTEYQERFGVDTEAWPEPAAPPETARSDAILAAGEFRLRDAGAPADLDSWCESLHGSPEHLEFFRALHPSDPAEAYRLAAAIAAMPKAGTEFLGFRLIKLLGRGAFGRVFLAQQGDLANRYVVLKLATETYSESQTLAQLQHTHIVPIYSLHRAGLFQVVCMPYFGSTTLADVFRELEKRKGFPESGKDLVSTLYDRRSRNSSENGTKPAQKEAPPMESEPASAGESSTPMLEGGSTVTLQMLEDLTYVQAVLWMGSRLADGLAYAHERGILHHDLKPANILLTDEGQPMLLDFNLAEDTKRIKNASVAHIGGTLPYMAPEHLEAFHHGKHPVDARSDIYSLGVILYELLTRRHPFPVRRGPVQELLPAMLQDRLQPPPRVRRWNRAVSPAGESIVRHCLEPDPMRRYQSARELQVDLERHLQHLPLKYAPDRSLRERARKWVRRHPLWASFSAIGAAVMALVLVLNILFEWYWARQEQREKLEALEAFVRFENERKTMSILLNAPARSPEQREQGLRLGAALLETYHLLDEDTDWREQPLVKRLPQQMQERLQQEMGELLLLLAYARANRALAPREEKNTPLEKALRLNKLADEKCYDENPSPRAWSAQRAELNRRLARNEQSSAGKKHIPEDSPQDRYLLARHYVFQKEYAKAKNLLILATRQDPENLGAWCLLGTCYLDGFADKANAASCYTTCIALWPRCHGAYLNRSLVYFQEKNISEAFLDFDEALRLEPEQTEAYVPLATHLLGQHFGAEGVAPAGVPLGALMHRLAVCGVMESDAFALYLHWQRDRQGLKH
jgi:serine/threonine protein kinase